MFEIVYETRPHGGTPFDGAMPTTSVVLQEKYKSADDAKARILAFQSPYDERWADEARRTWFGRTGDEPEKDHIWYFRPAAGT